VRDASGLEWYNVGIKIYDVEGRLFFIYLRSLQSVRRYSAIVVTGTVSDMQEIHPVKRLAC
jgi:hypothetical protein